MSVALNAETAARVAFDAASSFVESENGYYRALMSFRKNISQYYVPIFDTPAINNPTPPVIVWNGNVIGSGAAMQKMWEETLPPAVWEIQSFDCHMLNPFYSLTGNAIHPIGSGRNMSILVQVSGYVKFGDVRKAPQRGFSETFVLVPNPEANVEKWDRKNVKNWIIQSQTFRMVV